MADLINPVYLHKKTLEQARTLFLNNTPNSIQLHQFLTQNCYHELIKKISRLAWKQKSIPDLYQYTTTKIPKDIKTILTTRGITTILNTITSRETILQHAELCCFEHYDYTLLNDACTKKQTLFFELELTPTWNLTWGGYTSYVNHGTELVRNNPTPNTLTIVQQNKDTQHFIKYVNHFAQKNKRVLIRGILTEQ